MSNRDKTETENREVLSVYLTATHKVGEARDRYEKLFGVAHDSKDVGKEFSELFENAITEGESDVKVPLRIALALYLRPLMGRAVGNQGKANWHRRHEKWLKRRVKARKAELIEQDRKKPKVADELILADFHKRSGDFAPSWGIDLVGACGITESKVLRMLGRKE